MLPGVALRTRKACTKELLGSGQEAACMLHSICKEHSIRVIKFRMQLESALVVPVYSYGGHVWALDGLGVSSEQATRNCMVEKQMAFMHSLVGARCPDTLCLA